MFGSSGLVEAAENRCDDDKKSGVELLYRLHFPYSRSLYHFIFIFLHCLALI